MDTSVFFGRDPAVPVEVLEVFCGHVLLEVDTKHPLEILLGGPAGGEAVVVDALLDAGEIGEYIGALFSPQPNDDIKLPAGGHQHLDAIQVLAVLGQKLANGGKLLLLHAFLVEVFVVLKGLLGVERQHFHLGQPFHHMEQSIDPCGDAGVWQDADVGGLDDEEHQIPHVGRNTIVLEIVDAHQLLGGLG